MPNLNGLELREVTQANPTSEAVFKFLKNRKRSRSQTDIRQVFRKIVADGNEVNQKEYFEFWRSLEKKGIGSLVLKKNKPPRFEWGYSLKDLVRKIDSAAKQTTPEKEPVIEATPVARKRFKLTIDMGEGKAVSIPLSQDISPEEIRDLMENLG